MWDIFPKEMADRQMRDIQQVINTGQRSIAPELPGKNLRVKNIGMMFLSNH